MNTQLDISNIEFWRREKDKTLVIKGRLMTSNVTVFELMHEYPNEISDKECVTQLLTSIAKELEDKIYHIQNYGIEEKGTLYSIKEKE